MTYFLGSIFSRKLAVRLIRNDIGHQLVRSVTFHGGVTLFKNPISTVNCLVPLNFFQSRKMSAKIPSKEELKELLTPLQYHVTQEKGTEKPFTGKFNKTYDEGKYICLVCKAPLFSSNTKFDSGCGWPAFNDVLDQGLVKLSKDTSNGLVRTEVQCSKCDAHLGHVFDDGPPPTRKRFCINSASIDFIPASSS